MGLCEKREKEKRKRKRKEKKNGQENQLANWFEGRANDARVQQIIESRQIAVKSNLHRLTLLTFYKMNRVDREEANATCFVNL